MKCFGFFLIALSLVLSSCAQTTIQPSTTANDLVVFGTETNNQDVVSWEFASELPQDAQVIPHERDYASLRSGHSGYLLQESSILQRMTQEFMANKFMNIQENAPNHIKIELKSFEIEEFSPDSQGMQFLKALGDSQQRVATGARLKVLVTVNAKGKSPQSKLIAASSQDEVIGKRITEAHAETVNAVNNKYLMLLSKFLKSQGL